MLEELKNEVCQANRRLAADGLAAWTFGNVSGIDRQGGNVVIKPSGLSCQEITPAKMVVVSLGGEVVEGDLRPSSDTPTHLALYRAFKDIGGIAHAHSTFATAWAQARRDIPVLGTTHADYFRGPVPCTRAMRQEEILGDYEANTGKVIVERLEGLDPALAPAVLVASHGPFTWGGSAMAAAEMSAVLEHVAMLASATIGIEPYPRPMAKALLDRHFHRKHGPGAYYGQP